MAYTTNMSGTAQIDDSIIEEFDAQFIIAAADMGVMEQFVNYKRNIGAKSIEFPKYSQLGLQTTPLDEDDDIVSEAMSDAQIILTPAEYGNAVTTTKLANLQSGGKADLAAARLVGMNLGRSLDKLAILAAEGSSNALTPDGGAESALTATDVMTVSFLNQLYNKLSRNGGIQPLVDGMYVAVMHEDVAYDLRDSSGSGSWQDISKYQKSEQVLKNEIGALAGFRIVTDNNITINADAGASAVDTYHTLCMGFNALGKAESSAAKLVLSGPFDKLGRFVSIGWHTCLDYGIVDQDALWMGTTASSVGSNV